MANAPRTEAEIQVLIAMKQAVQDGRAPTREALSEYRPYFRKYAVLEDWDNALARLVEKGEVLFSNGAYTLTDASALTAAELVRKRPALWYWYNDFYETTQNSRAYAMFCERVFGADCSQHGFADMIQLAKLLEIAALGPRDCVLDLGCGNGAMDAHIAALTGAHVTGLDYIPEAIRQAELRARKDPGRLRFQVGELSRLDFTPDSFTAVISIDTLYFTNLDETLPQVRKILAPGGRMVVLYSNFASSWGPLGTTPWKSLTPVRAESCRPESTPLGEALQRHGLRFQTWDLGEADYRHALTERRVLAELLEIFEAEGNRFLYENRLAEAEAIIRAVETKAHARYLYHIVDLEKSQVAGARRAR